MKPILCTLCAAACAIQVYFWMKDKYLSFAVYFGLISLCVAMDRNLDRKD